jgi:hypothetical protein
MLLSTPNHQLDISVIFAKASTMIKEDAYNGKMIHRVLGKADLDGSAKTHLFGVMRDTLAFQIKRTNLLTCEEGDNLGNESYIKKLLTDGVVNAALDKMLAIITVDRASAVLENKLGEALFKAEYEEAQALIDKFCVKLNSVDLDPVLRNCCVHVAYQCGTNDTLKKFIWYIERSISLGTLKSAKKFSDNETSLCGRLAVTTHQHEIARVFEEHGTDAVELVFDFTPTDSTLKSWAVHDYFIGSKIKFELQRATTDVKITDLDGETKAFYMHLRSLVV